MAQQVAESVAPTYLMGGLQKSLKNHIVFLAGTHLKIFRIEMRCHDETASRVGISGGDDVRKLLFAERGGGFEGITFYMP